jgi:eukaryotic-like serine/threonine-protein kinase
VSVPKPKKVRYGRWVGKTLAERYWIRNIVGVGGNGIVYEADDCRSGQRVVVKVPKERSSPFILMRFRREALAGKNIRHPNVCALHDFGHLPDGTPFLVMERLVGESLATRLAREQIVPLHIAVAVMRQALEGIAAAHEQGIVHRDLKPGNIFLTNVTDLAPTAKVLDFGLSIASYFDESQAEDEVTDLLTAVGTVVGTPRYMSPEQVRGNRDFDPRVDVFACGAILYEMLTGERAFPSSNPRELFREILDILPAPPSHVNSVLPDAIDPIVAKAMAKDRDQRFANAAVFASALEKLLSVTPTPVAGWSTRAPGRDLVQQTDRQAYLKSRFRELVALRQQAIDMSPGTMSPGTGPHPTSTLDIPIVFEDSVRPTRIPNLVPSDDDPDGTAPTRPKRRKQASVKSSTERTVPPSSKKR